LSKETHGVSRNDHFGYNLAVQSSPFIIRDPIMIVFITGASAGFGAAMARTFVKNGHQVVLAARRKERLESLAKELGDSALPVTMDVTDKASIEEALSMLPQSWRQIDVLINNAGLALNTKPAHEVPLEDWDTMIAPTSRAW
jgi:3-hydroxy acid dehydrogenase/malonic semialdehyde reductase